MFHIKISPAGLADIELLYRYWADIAPIYALDLLKGIDRDLSGLTRWPLRCGLAYESKYLNFELRQFVGGSKYSQYRILFEVVGDTVKIHRIRASRQRPLREEDFPKH